MTQAELQESIQRIASVLMDRVSEAAEPLVDETPRPAHKEALLRRVLLYNASALEIATGPFPEVNTLDMIVFATLCRGALEQHWIPQRLGEDGQPLVRAFLLSEQELWGLAATILDPRQQADLHELIAVWQAEHPDQYRVEGVRFHEFAEHAGAVSKERAAKTRGVLGKVKNATRVADEALLISERTLFFAHRMPFLVRLQARIGVQETLSDSASRIENVEELFRQVPALRPLLADMSQLTSTAGATARETRLLVEAVEPYLRHLTEPKPGAEPDEIERVAGVTETLDSANQLAERSLALVRELRGSLPSDPERTVAAVEEHFDRMIRRWLVYLLILGFGWSVFFWSGSLVVKRLTR